MTIESSQSISSVQRPLAIFSGIAGLIELRKGVIKTIDKIRCKFDVLKFEFLENRASSGSLSRRLYKASRKEAQKNSESIKVKQIAKHFFYSAVCLSAFFVCSNHTSVKSQKD
jgi:hypothetical protein